MPGQVRSVRARIRRIIVLQAAVGGAVAVLLGGLYGTTVVAYSAFAGAAIGVIASSVYALRMATQGSDPKLLMRKHYVAEFSRFGVTVLLFAAVFVLFKGVAALPLFLTYAATLLVFWVALILD
ncbi:MAG TPA: ATP synthase subunit I [Burkholderiales bacterium]|nr:ATP synthase subunit I [Burkholderiales bacterium]